MIGDLPRQICIRGKNFAIRSDFRDVLKIISAFNDPNLGDEEKAFVCLYILYVDFDHISPSDYEEAFRSALNFIDCGGSGDQKPSARVMDWEQDELILFPAINKVAGCETRSTDYIHWWTFMGYYLEISEGVFSNVVNIRLKKAKGKKLEKWEQEFWQANKTICRLDTKLSEEEIAEKRRLQDLLD